MRGAADEERRRDRRRDSAAREEQETDGIDRESKPGRTDPAYALALDDAKRAPQRRQVQPDRTGSSSGSVIRREGRTPCAESRQRKVTWPSSKATKRWLEVAV